MPLLQNMYFCIMFLMHGKFSTASSQTMGLSPQAFGESMRITHGVPKMLFLFKHIFIMYKP